jgi:hypothetical protein
LQELCLEIPQAADFSLTPSMKTVPLIISATMLQNRHYSLTLSIRRSGSGRSASMDHWSVCRPIPLTGLRNSCPTPGSRPIPTPEARRLISG